jgi:hypothetical protein
MTKVLEGEHYCGKHQGNTSHYATENCTLCKALADIENRKEKEKTSARKTKPVNIVVEIQLADGCVSIYVGELVSRDAKAIKLRKASWISCTGRRHLFFAGQFDEHTEVEPYPDDTVVELPAHDAIITSWDHPLPRLAQ